MLSDATVISLPGGSLGAVLAKRGFKLLRTGDKGLVLYPRPTETLSGGDFNRYFRYLGRLSFRKILRRLDTTPREAVNRPELEAICSNPSLEKYLSFLEQMAMIVRDSKVVKLLQREADFGHTLEWYTAELLLRQFSSNAEWGIELDDLDFGGDFDVIAWVEPALVYVECKSGRQDNVKESQIRNFLQRSQDLAPEVAILLVDTDEDMQSLVERVNKVWIAIHASITERRLSRGSGTGLAGPPLPIKARSGFRGIYFGYRRIFVTNTNPSIYTQIQRCLRYYNTSVAFPLPFGDYSRINYITGEEIFST